MPSTTHTRQDYLAHRCTHREYYAQFVNESTRLSVRACIGVERLLASTDEHFNDIPLHEWDSLCGFHQSGSRITGSPRLPVSGRWLELGEGGPSLSSLVCVAKEAARQLVDEARAIGPWS